MVQFLLEAGGDVTVICRRSMALEVASEDGNEMIVKVLLHATAQLDGFDYYQACYNALSVASGRGHEAVVKVLLDATAQLEGFEYYQACYHALETASRSLHKAVVEVISEAASNFLLARMASGHLPVATGRELLSRMCNVDEFILWLATQQEHIDLMSAIHAIRSLKDALADRSNEALGRSIEVFLPSPTRQKDDVKLLIDHCRLHKLAWLFNSPKACVARYEARVRSHNGSVTARWRSLTIRGPVALLRAS